MNQKFKNSKIQKFKNSKIQKFKNLIKLSSILLATLIFSLFGCVSGTRIISHSFGFDFLKDSPDSELLDYRYGTSRVTGTFLSVYGRETGRIEQRNYVGGSIVVGDFLYVKWRNKKTGEIYEDTADLKDKLPHDMEHKIVTFLIKESQLYVYVVTQELHSKGEPDNGPDVYKHFKVVTIYPKTKKN
ncbi:hypothetical protein ACO0K7_19455 [Undibacterium sp. Ji67W]|uniref:hypothetical protein n=1 Tax=Undibacterium sp. Ji67W TaxID=3413042 RepID=UPI003BF0E7A3